MFGNRDDSLNYHLIMEGFYYDAEIEHIAEIIKNNLYFAVLEGEDNKVLKNTHDTYYFSIDDELVYTNYYFDFGPLNISCLYKYCYNLSNYLTYSQGLKRVVHYTTANPAKRVNAAFLMGCYAVIYLKMEPKEVHRILLNTGGSFKAFLDASQGFSQYTIHLLDCLQAIRKALTFNFFNFADFKVDEYDVYDKLQNGDMNWLLPRKFLAFIGPTDSEFLSGHSPDFYVKYFLDNDIKTVVRLNNKVYDATVFSHVGIEHHELFFPDGTTPTKQILVRFLDLSETARAAIAVHCKAGLGRTGSLIGAYIIKHYRMTAHEAIAWMRICRPGSVIGQQQGWLEKIEGWLWKQGNIYRMQHFGDCDKIPHHKYGVYSKEWPKEREKLIRHVQRRRLETQSNYVWPKPGTAKTPTPNYMPLKKSLSKSHSFGQKLALAAVQDEKYKKVSKLFNKIQRNSQSGNRPTTPLPKGKEMYKVQDIDSSSEQHQKENEMKLKQRLYNAKYRTSYDLKVESQTNKANLKQKKYVHTAPTDYNSYEADVRSKLDSSNNIPDSRPIQRLRKRIQSEPRELSVEGRPSLRMKKHFVDNTKPTQGDKLNEIKARRFTGCIEGEGNVGVNKAKQSKIRRRYQNNASLERGSKPDPCTSKKQIETLYPSKRSHLERVYTSRN